MNLQNPSAFACTHVDVRFGEFAALTDVSIEFTPGTVTALIGPNGAGKTTLMNVLSGLQRPSRGTVHLEAADITHWPSHRRAQRGLARSFQLINLYPDMTVLENVRLGLQRGQAGWFKFFCSNVASDRALEQRVTNHLREFGLGSRSGALAGELSHGEQRALELALSFTLKPQVILLDEPLAGVGHSELASFLKLIRGAIAGQTTVLVEHNMDAVMGLADRVVCLVGGKVLAAGSPAEIRADERVRRAYLGD